MKKTRKKIFRRVGVPQRHFRDEAGKNPDFGRNISE
jgi:hypothetical protein